MKIRICNKKMFVGNVLVPHPKTNLPRIKIFSKI